MHTEEEARVCKAEFEKVQKHMHIKTLEHVVEDLNKKLSKRNEFIENVCNEMHITCCEVSCSMGRNL